MVNASYNGRAVLITTQFVYRMGRVGGGVAVQMLFSVFSQSSIRLISILIPQSARQYVYLRWTLVKHLTV